MKLQIIFLAIVLVSIDVSECLFTPQNYPRVNIKFIHGPSVSDQSQYYVQNMTQILSHQKFSLKRPTVLYISGWIQSPDAETSQLMIKAYLKRDDYNLLVLDWSDYSVGIYSAVMIRISNISRIFGRTLFKLFDKGLNAKSFHCVGHSFGAHSCGIIGRELYQISNRRLKIGRITGLDPAGPGFYPTPTYEKPLSPDDALFVDAIHSDVFFIGTKFPVGHVDFYPNFNMVQPACPAFKVDTFFDFVNSMCSHFNAVRYWVDTLNPKYEKIFPSFQCGSWKDYNNKTCGGNSINYMGIASNPKKHGKFFIRLTSKHFYDGRDFYNWLTHRLEQRVVNLINLNI